MRRRTDRQKFCYAFDDAEQDREKVVHGLGERGQSRIEAQKRKHTATAPWQEKRDLGAGNLPRPQERRTDTLPS